MVLVLLAHTTHRDFELADVGPVVSILLMKQVHARHKCDLH